MLCIFFIVYIYNICNIYHKYKKAVFMLESKNMKEIPSSKLWGIANKAISLLESGNDVIRLELGRPDFDTPAHIKEAAQKALYDGKVHYVSHLGIKELREAIAERWEFEIGEKINPDKNILITQGGTEGLFISYAAFLNPGDEILIGDPGWISYFSAPVLFGAVVKRFSLLNDGKFRLSIDEIKSKITSKTKMILLNSPSNPTGGVISKREVEELAELVLEHNLMIISDEVYHRLMFENNEFYSFAKIRDLADRIITVDSFSKTYSMTGWRLGYVVASEQHILSLLKAHQQLGATCCSFGQYGAVAALRDSQQCVDDMLNAYQKRKEIVLSELEKMKQLSYIKPQGGLYIFIDVKKTGLSGNEFAVELLDKQKVALMPGDAFGNLAHNYVRLCIAESEKNLQNAMIRLNEFLKYR